MKTSFAQTFKDVADGVPSKDRIFPERTSKRKIVDETGADVPKERVLVLSPYDEAFGLTENTSTLLVDSTLRKTYETLQREINRSKTHFIRALKSQSKSKKNIEKEISSTFTKQDDLFYRALTRVKDEVASQSAAPFADIQYDVIFDDKVLTFLRTQDFRTAIKDYVEQYNQLLDASTYFSRETFSYYNASTVAKSLAANGFFDAKHTVQLNADATIEIASQGELDALVSREKGRISSDPDLRRKFAQIEKLLTKNVGMRKTSRTTWRRIRHCFQG